MRRVVRKILATLVHGAGSANLLCVARFAQSPTSIKPKPLPPMNACGSDGNEVTFCRLTFHHIDEMMLISYTLVVALGPGCSASFAAVIAA